MSSTKASTTQMTVRTSSVNRNTFGHAGWDELGTAFPAVQLSKNRSATRQRRIQSKSSRVQSEVEADANICCSPTSSPNDAIVSEHSLIEDFVEDDAMSDVDDNVIESWTPSSPLEQDTLIISSQESPRGNVLESRYSCLSPPLFSDDEISDLVTDVDDGSPSISAFASPVAKKRLKGSEWLKSLDEHVDAQGDRPSNELVQKRMAFKGALAQYFQKKMKPRHDEPCSTTECEFTALTLTAVLKDVGPNVFACYEGDGISSDKQFLLPDGDDLGVVISPNIVKQLMIRSGRIIRIRSPWRTMRVPLMNTTFILSPFVTDVEIASASSVTPLVTLRWRCSCRHGSFVDDPTECFDGMFIADDGSEDLSNV